MRCWVLSGDLNPYDLSWNTPSLEHLNELWFACQFDPYPFTDTSLIPTRMAESQQHGKWNKRKGPIEFDVHVFELVIEGVFIAAYEDRNKPSAKANVLRQV